MSSVIQIINCMPPSLPCVFGVLEWGGVREASPASRNGQGILFFLANKLYVKKSTPCFSVKDTKYLQASHGPRQTLLSRSFLLANNRQALCFATWTSGAVHLHEGLRSCDCFV